MSCVLYGGKVKLNKFNVGVLTLRVMPITCIHIHSNQSRYAYEQQNIEDTNGCTIAKNHYRNYQADTFFAIAGEKSTSN
jgi:hypothetical protein